MLNIQPSLRVEHRHAQVIPLWLVAAKHLAERAEYGADNANWEVAEEEEWGAVLLTVLAELASQPAVLCVCTFVPLLPVKWYKRQPVMHLKLLVVALVQTERFTWLGILGAIHLFL